VISGRGGDLDRAIFEDDTLINLGHDRVRSPRQVAMVGEPVADVGFKHLLGVSEECGRAVWAEDGQGVGCEGQHPPGREDVVQVRDVVAVEVGQ
jgi:hypothetical protein